MVEISNDEKNRGTASPDVAVSESVTLSSEKVDEALKFLNATSETASLTSEEERALLRKIDLHILPMFCLIYMLQFLDKTTISYASVMNIVEDASLEGREYNWLGSAFYIGYLCWEYVAAIMMQKLPLAKYTSANIVLWGSVLMLHAACKSFPSLMTVRLLLGMLEASVSPSFILFVSQWWRKGEQGFRTSLWFLFNGFAQTIGAVISYALAVGIKKNGYTELAAWQILFLATGGATVLAGILFFFLIPDTPAEAWFLTTHEKAQTIERLRENNQGIKNRVFKKEQAIEALKDPQVWIITLNSAISSIPNGFLTNFKNLILKGFGLSSEKALLYGAPSGAVQIVGMFIFGYMADKTKNRLYWGSVGLGVAVLGLALCVGLPQDNLVGNLMGFYLTNTSATGFTLTLSLISSNVAGYTKKTTANALCFIAYCVGNLIGPQTVSLSEAPLYIKGKCISIASWALCIILLVGLRFYYIWENRRRDKKLAALGRGYKRRENQEFLDLTDFENLEFRYVL